MSSTEYVDTLVEMGFPKNRALKALSKTSNQSVERAMEWLLAHSDDPDIDEPVVESPDQALNAEPSADAAAAAAATANEAAAQRAQSLKCDDCGKLLRSDVDVQAHAARTGHSNFSESTEEIKPLTAEQKAEQLAKLQEKMKQKRLEREQKEKADEKEREKMRRAQGKDLSLAKFEHEQKELKLIAEQKRREKAADRAAKQKVLDDIKRDREARAAAQAAAKAGTSAAAASPAAAPPAAAPPAAAPIPQEKEYTECRLQIRLPSGSPLTHTFKVNESLAAVRLYVLQNAPGVGDDFTFMTTFPRTVYTDEDMEKPLTALGLVPSAVMMVVKK